MTQDAFGDWKDLGTLTLTSVNEWYKFPITSYPIYTRSYRLTFQCSNFTKVRSFGWLRPVYFVSGAPSLYARAIRVYPKPEPLLLEFPIPQDLLSRNIDYQDFEIKRVLGRYRSSDLIWSVTLESLET